MESMDQREMGAVCTYFTIILALNSVFILGPVVGQHSLDHGDHDHHDHSHGEGMVHDHIDAFLTVKRHAVSAELSETKSRKLDSTLSAAEIHEVVSTLLDRLSCTKKLGNYDGVNCTVCSSVLTKRIFDVLEVNQEDGLTERQFEDAAPILLSAFTTSSLAFACDERSNLPTPGEYLTTLATRQGSPDRVTKDEMTSLLESLQKTYTPGTLGKCFDADELFREVYDVSLGASLNEMRHLSPLIVAYLLEGYCIGPAQYPNPDTFLEDIVAMYGHDGVIPLVDLQLILSKLKIGGPAGQDGPTQGGDNLSDQSNPHYLGYGQKRRRELQMVAQEIPESQNGGHEHVMSNLTRSEEVTHTCFSAEELLHCHGFLPEDGLDVDELKEICPSLLQQQLSGACSYQQEVQKEKKIVGADAYLYGSLCVLVVSLGAIVGGLIIPFLTDKNKDMIMSMLIAMAVSTLSGDALIHLIPLATGLHDHEETPNQTGTVESEHDFSYVWKTFLTLMSVYAFFLLETIMSICCVGQPQHSHSHGQEEASNGGVSMEKIQFQRISADEEKMKEAEETGDAKESLRYRMFKFGSLPVMILLGDGFHNFCDGLAMGASFAASIATGLSTSIAIFCHEVPHELGDLAILLKSGIKFKWALFLNFLSALTCFLGFYIGIVVGSTLVARQWILAITAGMFLYVGLVDMMPQIVNLPATSRPLLTFALQNVGFLFGAFIIVFISYLEEAIFITV